LISFLRSLDLVAAAHDLTWVTIRLRWLYGCTYN